ncbi:hypothetical protein E4U41_005879 [Claviceps citrina]|nr:hypothetical protein E4U41_005879 [Claviceps citrina]
MYICNSTAAPFLAVTDPKLRRELAGPLLTKDQINMVAATRAAQIEAGSELVEVMKALDKEAERARARKAAKAWEHKAAKARELNKAARVREQNAARAQD